MVTFLVHIFVEDSLQVELKKSSRKEVTHSTKANWRKIIPEASNLL